MVCPAHKKTDIDTRGEWKMEKAISIGKYRRRAAGIEREFIIKEVFGGTRKLPDIFSALLYAEYCRREEHNGHKCR
jgi:hypothetical protein